MSRAWFAFAVAGVLGAFYVGSGLSGLNGEGATMAQQPAAGQQNSPVPPVKVLDEANTKRPDEAAMRALLQRRSPEAIQARIKELESQRPVDHFKLAEAYFNAKEYAESLRNAELAIQAAPDNERAHMTLVRSLAELGDLDRAERSFRDAERRFPKSHWLSLGRHSLANANRKAHRPLAAAEWMSAYIDHAMQNFLIPENASALIDASKTLISHYRQAGHLDIAIGKVEGYRAWLAGRAVPDGIHRYARTLVELRAQEFELMIELGERDRATKLLAADLTDAETSLAASPLDVGVICRVATLLRVKSEILTATEPQVAAETHARYLQFLREQLTAHPDNGDVLEQWLQGQVAVLMRLVETHRVAEAERVLDEAKSLVARLAEAGGAAQRNLERPHIKYTFDAVKQRIDSGMPRAELVGRQAEFNSVADWVNGSALSPAELQDKVVLLDFWAVWCGPCIATFPKLRAWQDKYAERGLVVIGVTQYYGYSWDADAERPAKEVGLSHSNELSAIREFAKHHKLNYPLAVERDKQLWERYRVGAVPQTVLIDRAGTIRLITLGGNEASIKVVDEMLSRLIAEPRPAVVP